MGNKKVLKITELQSLCRDVESQFSKKTLVLLKGPLGAGKTALVQEMVRSLGGEKSVSPTYSLINSYGVPKRKHIYHIDLYRLEDNEDVESTGIWDLFQSNEGLIFIEWASRLDKKDLPVDWKKIYISIDYAESSEQRSYEVY